ncbi:MAG TPA: DNA repair exonuclease [Candidatus Limnocylindria bacterium]|nr:DNA repair exonuclease [Candidatus Limnocylindria bacterium]
MLRLMHMADVHLGARHHDLGAAAAAQRERQFAAFRRAVELAIAEKVQLVLICGDLFDSNNQPRRSVERAAAELARLAERGIPVVIIPGTHDVYDSSSIYRAFDLAALAGLPADGDQLVVLTDTRSEVRFADLGLTVHGRVSRVKRAAASPLAGFHAPADDGWQIGMIHGSLAVPGKVEQDDVLFSEAEVEGSGLDYLALGHWHSRLDGRAGGTTWAYSGALEPLALDQDGAGQVLLVTLSQKGGQREVRLEARPVGQSKVRRIELDAGDFASQPALAASLTQLADADLVADVRLVGLRRPELDLHLDELEQQLAPSFLRLRLRDDSLAPLPEGPLPPADTIMGAFVRDLTARIEEGEREADEARVSELREALHIGRLLLDDPERVGLA